MTEAAQRLHWRTWQAAGQARPAPAVEVGFVTVMVKSVWDGTEAKRGSLSGRGTIKEFARGEFAFPHLYLDRIR